MYSLGIVTEAFLGIILTLDSWIYSLISSAYKIFMAIASARILSSDAYTAIANKVYVIIGVGMLFVLAYAIMKAIIDPDQMSKGDMAGGKILKSIAIAVIGLIITPLLFDLAYMAQGKMLEDDILGKLFFRTGDSTVESLVGGDDINYDEELKNTGGAVAAVSVWRAFFYPADGEDPDKIIADPDIARLNATMSAVGCAALAVGTVVSAFYSFGLTLVVGGAATLGCINAVQKDEAATKIEEAAKDGEVSLSEAYVMVASGESFAIFQAFLEPIDEGQIKYTWFISTVCGAFVAYAFVSYAIDMGLRAAKLAYYQIIAPVPLILGVLPKNGDTVSKFAKGVLSTFMEVFVRISVVYIVVYIIAHLNELFSTVGALWDNDNLTNVESLVAMALLIIGLVLFAKEAPKIIGETFGLKGDSGLKGLNIMDKLRRGEVFTAGTVAGSTIRSGVQSFNSSFGRKTKIGRDANGNKVEIKRGFGERLAGGIGAGMFGAGSGAVRSGVGRARSGKAVGGFREMHDNVGKTTRDVHDAQGRFQEFDRINDTTEKKVKKIGGMISNRVRNWAVGDEDVSGLKRQEAAFEKIREGESKLESTVGNDAQVKAANRYVADLASYQGAEIYSNTIRDMFDKIRHDTRFANDTARYKYIAEQLGFAGDPDDVAAVTRIGNGGRVTSDDLNAARDAADDRLKTTKKDAVSRKLAEAHATGIDNDTSRMAKQYFGSQEMLRYADEFEYLTFDTYKDANGNTVEVTFGDYLRQNLGSDFTRNGTISFDELFKHQAASKTQGGVAGAPAIEFEFKEKTGVSGITLGITNDPNITIDTKDIRDAVFDLKKGEVIIDFGGTIGTHRVKVEDLQKSGIEIASSETLTAVQFDPNDDKVIIGRTRGTSKKTVFAAAKDKGESKGDEFRNSDLYKDSMAAAREAEKNKGGNK